MCCSSFVFAHYCWSPGCYKDISMCKNGMLDRSNFHLTQSYPTLVLVSKCFPSFFFIADPFSMFPPRRALEAIGQNLSIQYERWLPRVIASFLAPFVLALLSLLPLHLCSMDFIRLDMRWNWILPRMMWGSSACLVGKMQRLREFCFIITGTVCLNLHPMVKSGYTIRWVLLCFLSTVSMFFLSVISHLFILCVQNFTQYIPLPVSELDSWLKTPAIYVFDCSAARLIVNAFAEVKLRTNYSYYMDTCWL